MYEGINLRIRKKKKKKENFCVDDVEYRLMIKGKTEGSEECRRNWGLKETGKDGKRGSTRRWNMRHVEGL